jgi:hypothetical protein
MDNVAVPDKEKIYSAEAKAEEKKQEEAMNAWKKKNLMH